MEPRGSCPVCEAKSAQILFRPKASPGPVFKCSICGMIYVANIEDNRALIFDGPVIDNHADPKILISTDLDDVRDSWEFNLLPDKKVEWPALRQNAIDALDRIKPHVDKLHNERRILDFGSGWGFFLAVAKELGWTPYGLEPLPASAVYARSTFGLNITTDILHDNTFPPDFFDVITSFQVFEHLPYPKENIRHIYKMLRQGGVVLIEVPNFDTWTMQIMRSRHRHFVQDHLNFFSVKTLGQLLSESGFVIIDYYHPTRRMSIRHLNKSWIRRYMPAIMADVVQKLLQRTKLWEKTIGVNFGDIIAVIARKA
jgi:2-polyprenyl-3-methyl-5-hydroxy-6-metoxy-1,4-benzoquinol methylase